jgi:hypothetical protein
MRVGVRGVEEWATINHAFVSGADIQQQGFIVFFFGIGTICFIE